VPVRFSPTTESEYAEKLSDLQKIIADRHEEETRIARRVADRHEEEIKIERYARTLATSIKSIESTGIPDDLLEMSEALVKQKDVLATFKKKRARFGEIISAGDSTKCEYVNSEIRDFFFPDLRRYFYSDFYPLDSRHQQAVYDINMRIENAPAAVNEARAASMLLTDALSIAEFPAPDLPMLSGDEPHTIDKYEELAKSAAFEIEAIESEYVPIANEIIDIMSESEKTLERLRSECRY
jgi:hypothetical protein